jgi:hypothetical protein
MDELDHPLLAHHQTLVAHYQNPSPLVLEQEWVQVLLV